MKNSKFVTKIHALVHSLLMEKERLGKDPDPITLVRIDKAIELLRDAAVYYQTDASEVAAYAAELKPIMDHFTEPEEADANPAVQL